MSYGRGEQEAKDPIQVVRVLSVYCLTPLLLSLSLHRAAVAVIPMNGALHARIADLTFTIINCDIR